MRTLLRFSFALTLLSLSAPAGAQEVTRMPDQSRHSVGIDGGIETAFVARATYMHRVDLGLFQDTRLFARAALPVVTPDLGDWALDAGLRATPLAWHDFRLALLAGPILRKSENEAFSATAIGATATVLVGYESLRWGLSAEGSYEQMFTTYIQHTDRYRELVYADAKNGGYALSGSTARGGLRAGVRLGSVEITARGGLNTTGRFEPVMPPYYVTLGASYAF